jgi:hypothetical protein
MFLTDAEHAEQRLFSVRIRRRLDPDWAHLRYWSASVNGFSKKPNDIPENQWGSAPRLSRDEFVALVSKSDAELNRRHAGQHLEHLYVDYHIVREHEQELSRSLKGVFATTKGEVIGKHRGLMLRMRKVAPLPDQFNNRPGPGWYLNFAFDPVHNHFYASWMGKPTYRYRR